MTSQPRARMPRRIGFYCRSCRRKAEGDQIPYGWYTVERKASRGRVRLGTYCSAYCLSRSVPWIEDREREKGDDWESASGVADGSNLGSPDRRGHSAMSRDSLERMMRARP